MTAESESEFEAQRRDLVETIASEVRATHSWLGKDALDPRVMAAMLAVPRHCFVPRVNRDRAYANRPQPIGHGQTISQPYVVAVMTDLAAVAAGNKVLEVGSGCGYQAAVLAEMGAQVFAIEVIPELVNAARERLARLGYERIRLRLGDGSLGWPEEAPFDAILVSAAAWQRIPPALVAQLVPGGRLVIPVDRSRQAFGYPFLGQEQQLILMTKDAEDHCAERLVLPVSFVPLVESGEPLREEPRA
jgi:protein-L-isoaspartate(D-aspartate) O-methyltransferase